MSYELTDWYDRAGVRTRPRRMLAEDHDAGLQIFPAGLVRHLQHEAVAALEPSARNVLLTHHFYQYMLFTVDLETKVVNPGAMVIAHGEVDLELTRQARLDAFKIYCDEGYHALFSRDIVEQVEAATGITTLPYDFAPRLDRLNRTADRFLPEYPQLARVLQVVAFETVVTTFLSRIPYDPTVHRAVRLLVGDHLRDEIVHHAFFARFFKELWASLSPSMRQQVACAIPHFVADSLRTDTRPIHAALRSVGLSPDDCADVLRDCYGPEAEARAIRAAGRHTLALCEAVGAFDIPAAREQVELLGLAPEPAA